VDARLGAHDRPARPIGLDHEVHRGPGVAGLVERREALRRPVAPGRRRGRGDERAQHDFAPRLFGELAEGRAQRGLEQRAAGPRRQNALRPGLPEAADPHEGAEEPNLVRRDLEERRVDALGGRGDLERMNLSELVDGHVAVEQRRRHVDAPVAHAPERPGR